MSRLATVQATDVQLEIAPNIKRKVQLHLKQYEAITEQMRVLKAAQTKELNEVEKLREVIGAKSFDLSGFKVTRVTGDSSRLDQKKMIADGVTPAMIEEWTTTKPKKAFTKITCPGAKPEVEEEE